MFAPQPRSQFTQRTYSNLDRPTTTKKNLNKENDDSKLPSKTPSRAGPSKIPTTTGHVELGKPGTSRKAPGTVNRDALGLKTGQKGKSVMQDAPAEDIGKSFPIAFRV